MKLRYKVSRLILKLRLRGRAHVYGKANSQQPTAISHQPSIQENKQIPTKSLMLGALFGLWAKNDLAEHFAMALDNNQVHNRHPNHKANRDVACSDTRGHISTHKHTSAPQQTRAKYVPRFVSARVCQMHLQQPRSTSRCFRGTKETRRHGGGAQCPLDIFWERIGIQDTHRM